MTLPSNEALGKKLVTKTFWLYFFILITWPAGYFIRVIISNKLSVGDVWVFFSIYGLINVISLYNDLWFTEALQYFIPKYLVEKKYNNVKTILICTAVLQFLSGIVISLGLYFSSDFIAQSYFHVPESAETIRLFCIYFFGINFVQASGSLFLALQDTFSQNMVDAVRTYGVLLFLCIFWWMQTLSLGSITWAWNAGMFMWLIVAGIVFLTKYRHIFDNGKFVWDTDVLRIQVKYAFWAFLGANAGMLLTQVNQQMVIFFLWPEQAWFYANYYTLFIMFSIIVGPLLSLLFPIFAQLLSENNMQKVALFQNFLYKYFLMFSISMSWLFLSFGPEISAVLLGTKFTFSGSLIAYIAPFLTLNMMLAVNYSILASMGKIKQRVKYLSWSLAANIICNILFLYILQRGIYSILISTVVSRWILWRYSFKIINAHQKIILDRRFLIKNWFIVWILCVGLVFLKPYFFVFHNAFRFVNIAYLVACGILYYICFAAANIPDIKFFIKELKSFRK